MSKFKIGQCAGLKLDSDFKNRYQYFQSRHILKKKDIERGYYYAIGDGFNYRVDLSNCVLREPNTSFLKRDQSLKGKITKTLSIYKMYRLTRGAGQDIHEISSYIIFKGRKIKVVGFFTTKDFNMYWENVDGNYYRTKMYTNEDGSLILGIGVYKHMLSDRQERMVTKYEDLFNG